MFHSIYSKGTRKLIKNNYKQPLKAVTNNKMSLKAVPIVSNLNEFSSNSNSNFSQKELDTNKEEDVQQQQQQEKEQEPYPQLQQNVFTDLNLLISDDEIPTSEMDDHDSCLENVN